jgi:hypothetical protein
MPLLGVLLETEFATVVRRPALRMADASACIACLFIRPLLICCCTYPGVESIAPRRW